MRKTVFLARNISIPPVTLSLREGDEVCWGSTDGEEYLVVFENGTPFGNWKFVVPRKGASEAVAPVVQPPEGAELDYKYHVFSRDWHVDPKLKVRH
ncbi:MAG: hypothetical protein ACE5JH_08535 [Acidobacteriota bacterium]